MTTNLALHGTTKQWAFLFPYGPFMSMSNTQLIVNSEIISKRATENSLVHICVQNLKALDFGRGFELRCLLLYTIATPM